MLSVLAATAVLAPWIAPRDPLAQNRAEGFRPPSLAHPFGTDEFGRDILSRVMHGARISLLTGVVAVLIGGLVGVPLGLVGGFAGGLPDALIMRVLDFLLAVPAILLTMVIIAVLGPGSFNAMLAVGVVSVPAFAHITRASTLSLRERTGHRLRGAPPVVDRPSGHGLQCSRHGDPDVLARHPSRSLLRALASLAPAVRVRAHLGGAGARAPVPDPARLHPGRLRLGGPGALHPRGAPGDENASLEK